MTTHTEARAALRYLDTIGFAADAGGRGFHLPVDLAIRSDGRIFVMSRSSYTMRGGVRIGMVDLSHEFFGDFSSYGDGDGQVIWPTAMAFDSMDRLFVADEQTQRISIFDGEGNFLSKWGVQGSGAGELNGPSGLAFDGDDNLYVVDHRNHRVQIFTADGVFQAAWGRLGDGEGELNLPWGIAVDRDGCVYVADWRNDRIQRFSHDGRPIDRYGNTGRGEGEFMRPSDVTVDADGFIYVADWGNQRVQVFDSEWNFQTALRGEATLSAWAEEYLDANADEKRARATFNPYPAVDTDDPHEQSARIEPYFWNPISVEVDKAGRLYVVDANRHRFQVYEKEPWA